MEHFFIPGLPDDTYRRHTLAGVCSACSSSFQAFTKEVLVCNVHEWHVVQKKQQHCCYMVDSSSLLIFLLSFLKKAKGRMRKTLKKRGFQWLKKSGLKSGMAASTFFSHFGYVNPYLHRYFKGLKKKKKPPPNLRHKINHHFDTIHIFLQSHTSAHCLKITQNVAFEFLNFGTFHQFLFY